MIIPPAAATPCRPGAPAPFTLQVHRLSDQLVPFVFEDADVRGAFVSLDGAWREVLARRAYPGPVRALLGEAMAACALLAGSLKFDGTLILSTRADDAAAPVRLMVVECAPGLALRAMAKLGRAGAAGRGAGDASLEALTGGGRLTVTLDPRDGRETYQGIVALAGAALGPALERYMRQSEQTDTLFLLAADAARAAGLMLQRLPRDGGAGATMSRWDDARALAGTLGAADLLAGTPQDLLRRLFHEIDVRVFAARPVRFECRCSRERVAGMLRMLGQAEVNDVVAEQGQVSVACEFCSRSYGFDAVEAAQLFLAPPAAASQARH
jgi:molecular chaperone Hsp33